VRTPVRVLSTLGDADLLALPADLRAEVEVTVVPMKDPLPPGVEGDVLVTVPTAAGHHLPEAFRRGVRWVHVTGTGIDGIPLEGFGSEVVLTNSRGASAVAISEWVLAVMLAFEKQLPQMWLREAPPAWHRVASLGTLARRRLALVGLGGIGLATARRALAFDMSVRALRNTSAASPHPEVELARSLTELLADADHVVVAAPLTERTRHLLGAEAFALMKPGVHLVNIARGGLIHTDALREALDNGTVAMASLDAVEPEPLPAGHWLYAHPNVRLSPHVSWGSPDAFPEILRAFADNLRRFVAGEPLESVVDPAQGY